MIQKNDWNIFSVCTDFGIKSECVKIHLQSRRERTNYFNVFILFILSIYLPN